MASKQIAMGIDLGTSNSCVAIVEEGVPKVIANEWGERTHASVVTFLDDGAVVGSFGPVDVAGAIAPSSGSRSCAWRCACCAGTT